VGEEAPLMKRATKNWSVEERGSHTLVTTSPEVELNGGIFWPLVEPLRAAIAKHMGARSLAGFKVFVENADRIRATPEGCCRCRPPARR
jgi:hypothetical protein